MPQSRWSERWTRWRHRCSTGASALFRWFVANLTLSVVVSFLALGVSLSTFYLTQWHRQSGLRAVVDVMYWEAPVERHLTDAASGQAAVTFTLRSRVRLLLVNRGNAQSALLAARPVVTTDVARDCVGGDRFQPGVSVELPDKGFAGPSYPLESKTVPAGPIVSLELGYEHRGASLPIGVPYDVCLQLFAVDHTGEIFGSFFHVGRLTFEKEASVGNTGYFKTRPLDVIP